MSYGDVKSAYGGAGGWGRRGCATGAPRSTNRQGEEQHRHTECGSHTRRDKGEHSRQGGGAQQGRRGNQSSGNREPEWSGWESVCIGGSDNKGDGLASQPRRYRVPGQPLLNRHQVGGVSRSPDGLFAQQEREPIRGRTAVRGEGTYGGQPGQHVEEQEHTHTETQRGRLWTACGQRCVDSKNSQTTLATTSTCDLTGRPACGVAIFFAIFPQIFAIFPPFSRNHLEERVLDQAQARTSYTPPLLVSFA